MGENTEISWCDHTFNPWIGCTKVSVGEKGACENCYAEVATPTRAMHIMWGAGKPRHRTSPSTWALPLRWERSAEAFLATHGRRQRVFCASLADVFDNEVNPQWRVDLFDLIRATPRLDWLLLTKRIGNARDMLPGDWGDGYSNVWLGSTVVTQEEVDRDVPKLLATPARVRFLSCEPLQGPIRLAVEPPDNELSINWLRGFAYCDPPIPAIDWVIAGGESGHHARPSHPDWFRLLRDQCVAARVAFHFKQWGAYLPSDQAEARNYAYDEYSSHDWGDGIDSIHLKKKQSGRTLDGREWNEFPRSPT